MYEALLLLHVLAATIWTGGHIVLATVVLPAARRDATPEQLLRFESGYEKIGIPALLVQVATGLVLANEWLGETGRWFDLEEPASRLISLKLLLLAMTVALAADARLRLIPRLTRENLGALAWHVIPVTVIAILFVVVGVSFRTGWF